MSLFDIGAIRYELKELLKIEVRCTNSWRIALVAGKICGSAGSKADLIRLYSYQYKLTSSSSSSLKTGIDNSIINMSSDITAVVSW